MLLVNLRYRVFGYCCVLLLDCFPHPPIQFRSVLQERSSTLPDKIFDLGNACQ